MASRIAIGIMLLIFGVSAWAAYTGWGLPTTTVAAAERQAIASRRSVRMGYAGGGPRYGK